MGLYIGHDSALRYWLTKTGDEAIPDVAPEKTLAFAESGIRLVRGETLPLDYSKQRPLHLLVPNKELQWRATGIVAHAWSHELPTGAFYYLAGSNRVASPEFTFLLIAADRPLREVVEIGCYLCGCFSIGDDGHSYTGKREPLTTPEKIGAFLGKMKNAYGVRRAREALVYVVANTASPMEVFIAMEYRMPVELSGWGMPDIAANQRVNIDPKLRSLVDSDYLVGDIYMPSVRGDTEYESYEYHTGKYRLDHTQARRNVLEAMGVKTVSATYGQIESNEKFDSFMWMVEKRFGLPHRDFTLAEKNAQYDLHDFLIEPTRRRF